MDPNNIYATYASALAGGGQGNPNQNAGNIAQANEKIDEVKQSNDAQAKSAAGDASKARMVLLPKDQGYAFYDGTGKRLSINDYSLLVGKTPAQILQDSPNPQDQQFVQDYTTLHSFVNAWTNGDKTTLAKMRAADPQTFNNLTSTYKSPADVISAFTQHWSQYYSPDVSTGPTKGTDFAPNMNLNTPDKNQATVLGGTNLAQILNPSVQAAPAQGPNLGILDRLNPFSGAKKQVSSYEDYLKNNPWAAYQVGTSSSPYASYASKLFGGS